MKTGAEETGDVDVVWRGGYGYTTFCMNVRIVDIVHAVVCSTMYARAGMPCLYRFMYSTREMTWRTSDRELKKICLAQWLSCE